MATIDDLKERMAQSSEEKVVLQPLLADEAQKRKQVEEQQQNKPIEVEYTIETDPTKIAVAKEVEAPKMDFERMAQITDPNRPLSPQEQEKLDKRRRNNAIFSALGDGLSALSNLYFTSQGAYDMSPDPSQSLSAKSKERWDRIKAERDAKDLRFFENVQRRRAERLKREDAPKLTPYQQAIMEWKNRNSQDKAAYNMAEAERKVAEGREKLRQANKALEIREKYNNWRMANKNTKVEKVTPFFISSDEKVEIPSHIVDDVIMDLWSLIPENERTLVGSQRADWTYAPPTKAQIEAEVRGRLRKDPKMQELLRIFGKQKSATETKQETQAKKPATPKKDFSQYEETADEDFSQYKRK